MLVYLSYHSFPLIPRKANPKIMVKISSPTSNMRLPICAARTESATVKLLQIKTAVLIVPSFRSIERLPAANSLGYQLR